MARVPLSLRVFQGPLLPAIFWGLLALSPRVAFAQSGSTFTTFDAPGAGQGANQGTFPWSMNSKGMIAGWVNDSNDRASGFLRRADGTMTIIRVPGARDTQVYGINDAGTMVGLFDTENFTINGFIRTSDGKFTYFHPLGTQFWEAMTIDNLGNVAGTIISTYDFFACYIRTADGTITTFTPPAGFECEANDIVAGTVSGMYGSHDGLYTGFLRHPDGTYTVFPIGYQLNEAVINSANTAAGSFALSDGSLHGYVRAANGAVTYFGFAGSTNMSVADINSAGTVIGFHATALESHAFQRLSDGSTETIDVPGFQATSPRKINDAGNITGWVADSNNVYHGFLFTP